MERIPEENSLDSLEGIDQKGIDKNEIERGERERILRSVFANIDGLDVVDVSNLSESEFWDEYGNEHRKARELGVSPEEYSDFVLEALKDSRNKDVGTELAKHFSGKLIIDIGPGDNNTGYRIARALGASGYVAIEPFFAKSLAEHLMRKPFMESDRDVSKDIPYVVLRTDALNALSEMISGSANIMSIGTDSTIIKDRNYRDKVNQLLHEKLGTNVFMGSETVFCPRDAKSLFSFSGREGVGRTEIYENILTEESN